MTNALTSRRVLKAATLFKSAALGAALIATLIGTPALMSTNAYADGHGAHHAGVVKMESAHSAAMTLDKLETIVTGKGFTVFARIDHAAGAAKVGENLGPAQTLIFGNPKVGTKLMQSQPSASLDLPIRVAAWTEADGTTWVAYNDPAWLAARHAIDDRAPVVQKMTGALGKLVGAAAK